MGKLILLDVIAHRIHIIRGMKVMLSSHLAELYGINTRTLNQAVKRNRKRFPGDFMFQLTIKEAEMLVSQSVIPHRKFYGGTLPYAFTEQGVAMLSSVLHSERAVQMNIAIMRTFVKLREILSTHKELAQKLAELEEKISQHDSEIQNLFDAIRQLMKPIEKPKHPIGFIIREPKAIYKVRKK